MNNGLQHQDVAKLLALPRGIEESSQAQSTSNIAKPVLIVEPSVFAIDLTDCIADPNSSKIAVQLVKDCFPGSPSNIPIQTPKSQGFLRELASNHHPQIRQHLVATGSFSSKKWRRRKGKENMISGKAKKLLADISKLDKKRRWELQDEEDVEVIAADRPKKLKECSEIPEEDMTEVVVGSLN